MLAPAVASTTLRRVLRGSAIGMGLLASIGLGAPAALASPLSGIDGPLVAGVAVSWPLEAHLAAAPVPGDLDLSGARFDIVGPDDRVLTSCDTEVDGTCPITIPDGMVPGTTYRLRQDATRPVPGLVPSTAIRAFTACTGPESPGCPGADSSLEITDFSLFRTGLTVAVRDGSTRAPLDGASYSLTGPDYRRRPPLPHRDQVTTFPRPSGADIAGTVVSSSDGLLTYQGWFLDGEWALTPEVTPPGYRSSGVLPLTLPARTADPAEAWVSTVDLAPDDGAVSGTGGGGAVLPPASTPSASTPSGAPATAPAAAREFPAPASTRAAAAVPTSAGVPTSAAVPTFSTPLPFVDEGGSRLPSGGDPATGDPLLGAAASTSRLDVGLIGFGVLFVTIAVFGVGYLRRRVRG